MVNVVQFLAQTNCSALYDANVSPAATVINFPFPGMLISYQWG